MGNRRHNSHNDLAAAYAAENGLAAIAGSDYHELEDLTGTGVRFASEVRDNASLLAALCSKNFEVVAEPSPKASRREFPEKMVDKPDGDRYNILRDTRGGLCFCNSSPYLWAKKTPCP